MPGTRATAAFLRPAPPPRPRQRQGAATAALRPRQNVLGRSCFIASRARRAVFGAPPAGPTIATATLQLGSVLRENDMEREEQSPVQGALLLKPYRVNPLDILIIAAFCAALLLVSSHFQRLSRLHAIVGVCFFAIQSLVYCLRLRYIYRQMQKDSSVAHSDVEHFGKRLEMNEQRIASTVKDVLRAEVAGFGAKVQETEGMREGREASLRKSLEEGLRAVNSRIADLQEVYRPSSLVSSDTYFSAEVETLRAKLKDSEKSVVSLQIKMQSLQRSLSSSENTIATARQEAEIAAEREMLLRADIVALSRRVEEVNSIRERLQLAETRNAGLEQSVLRGSRTQEDLRIKASDAELRVTSMSQVSNVLRDTLLNVAKTFPAAGRFLFDDPKGPPSMEVDPRRFRPMPEVPSRGKSVGGIVARPNSETAQPLNWRESDLNHEPIPDVGLPDDGGFGTDLLVPNRGAPEEPSSPFASLRSSFQEPSVQSINVKEIVDNLVLNDLSDLSETDSADKVASMERKSDPATLSDDVNLDAAVSGSYSEKSVQLEQEASLNVRGKQSDIVNDDDRALGNDTSVSDIGNDANESIVSPSSVGSSTSKALFAAEAEKLETLLVDVRALTKQGRQKDLSEAESSRVFFEALELMRSAPSPLAESVRVRSERGLVLMAWAKLDLRSEKSKGKLGEARSVLTGCVEEEPGNEDYLFNLALCLCLLASLQESTSSKELYEEACVYYDRLVETGRASRVVFFNCGLAYISRARLGDSTFPMDHESIAVLYKKASAMFRKALELHPEDSKSILYLDECQEKL